MAIKLLPDMKSFGGENAVTAINNYSKLRTAYLEKNNGYGVIVGVKFIGKDGKLSNKTYGYVSLTATERVGDNPTVEVTNKYSRENQFVSGKHTVVVSTAKSGIDKNAELLDRITEKGINLKVIDRQSNIRERLFPAMKQDNFKNLQKLTGG